MNDKLERHEYHSAQQFKDDIGLVLSNARLYNGIDTTYYKISLRIEKLAEPILQSLDPIDIPNSSTYQYAADLTALLDTDVVESLLEFDYKLPKTPKPSPVKSSASSPTKRKEPATARPFVPPRRTRRLAAAEALVLPDGDIDADDEDDRPDFDAAVRNEKEKSKAQRQRESRDRSKLKQRAQRAEAKARKADELERQRLEEAEVHHSGEIESRQQSRLKAKQAEQEVAKRKAERGIFADAIDNRESFGRFNEGWILPEGTSRRASSGRPIQPLPRKSFLVSELR